MQQQICSLAKISKESCLTHDNVIQYISFSISRNKQSLVDVCLTKFSPGSESIEQLNRQTVNFSSVWGSIWERSPFVSRSSTLLFRVVPGKVRDSVRTSGFKRETLNLDRAPKMLDSFLLNSWLSFLVTRLSVFSETCVIYSSLILRAELSRDWQFLGFSNCIFLGLNANFPLFPNVAIVGWAKSSTVVKTEFFMFFIQLRRKAGKYDFK